MSEQPKHVPQAAPDAPAKAPKVAPQQRALDKVKVSADARASLQNVQDNVEKKEEYDTLYHKEYGAGEYVLTPADLEKAPAIRKEFTHWAIVGVNGQSFEPNKARDIGWFEDKSQAAKLFSRLYINGQIQTNFPTMRPGNMGIMLAMIDRFARFEEQLASGQVTINSFKSGLEKEFGRDNIYGPDGVLNLLLALQRAHAVMRGQEFSTTLYDLRLAKNKFTASYRFAELRRKKELLPMDFSKPAAKKPVPKPAETVPEVSEAMPREVALMKPKIEKLAADMQAKFGVDLNITLQNDPKGNPAFLLTTQGADGKDAVIGRMKMVYKRDVIGDGSFDFYSTIDQERAYGRFADENFDDPNAAEKHLRTKVQQILKDLPGQKKEFEKQYQKSVMDFFETGSELAQRKVRVRPISGKLVIGGVNLSDNSFSLNEKFYVKFDWPSRQMLITYYTAGDGKNPGQENIEDAFDMGDMNDSKHRENLANKIEKIVLQADKLNWD